MIDCKTLVSENNSYLQQAIDLIEKLDDNLYTNHDSPYYMSPVGKHIRHLLDFYENFLMGWREMIDYDARRREERLENDRLYCIQKIKETMNGLKILPAAAATVKKPLLVKNDEIAEGHALDSFAHSTIERELQFLKFHVVHHFAIIAIILKIQGFVTLEDFGIAPSTLKFLREQKDSGLE
jgi:hypothetical protein